MMTRIAFLHTTNWQNDWRVYPCLVMSETSEIVLGKRRRIGKLLYVDETGGIRIAEYAHYADRTSANYWVSHTEIAVLHDDICRDYEARHLWLTAMQDATEAMILMGHEKGAARIRGEQ